MLSSVGDGRRFRDSALIDWAAPYAPIHDLTDRARLAAPKRLAANAG
jgi:hypothetical protein